MLADLWPIWQAPISLNAIFCILLPDFSSQPPRARSGRLFAPTTLNCCLARAKVAGRTVFRAIFQGEFYERRNCNGL
jgi:hypothetical protein